ncbi:polymorphic toxin-type HINT domain-containing protein [Streptomyces sp. NPDC091292]|uniref:polymorphic toxin-type HINT domain-containing protein n=1 Tax=Streptomyces sp. NPDC091292 TaxID=3365991 RepID=UPI003806D955
MLSGLLGAPAAVAAESAALPAGIRAEIVGYWETGGTGLQAAAEQALLGGDEAIQKFLEEAASIQYDDNRIETARLAMTGGPGVRQAAKDAMLLSPAELETWLLTGFQAPLDEDQKVEIARLVTLGGRGVQEAGKTALQGTSDDRELFLAEGQYEAQKDDNRVETARLASASSSGPNLKAAAKLALQGSFEDIEEFLAVGQFVARNRDQEHATVEELVERAKAAGKDAEDATKKAEEASKKAITASQLAKEAAAKAAAETEAAKDDATKAAVKSQQAADAARAAAEAAQEAIGSANAASAAARRASLAAAQTASAAAAAAEAANKAHQAAIAAAGDRALADGAYLASAQARLAGAAARTAATAADNAGKASDAAAGAALAAKSASSNARAAADAADEANDYADAAGVSSNAARQAAAEARRHAIAADRAADRSSARARQAATAAYGARDAANSAAAHADKAADFAKEAADQAGNSATYAAVSKKNADAAKVAADAATTAVAKAKEITTLARETENDDLLTRTEGGIEQARSMKAVTEVGISTAAATQQQALALDTTASELAQEAGRPDVDVQATAAKGRQLAMQAIKLLGPWHKEAAARALSGTDQDVLDYLRTRWKEANDSDIRQRVVNLSTQSPYASVRTAATEVLTGTPAQIEAFHTTGQFEAGLDDMKVDAARLAETGGPSVSQAAKAALADGTGKALATFLQVGQYGESATDEKVITARLAETGGPEVQSAAKIALAGPPQLQHEFVTVGQYMAQRKDDLATHHVHQVQRLIAEGSLVAAKAQADAWRAAEAAAKARNAAGEAAAAALEAQKSADQAAQHAADADASADDAEQSAANAAASAATARNAANRADADATAAEDSAAAAEFSAAYARQSATDANRSAAAAKAEADAAGKSAEEAEAAAKEAWQHTRNLYEREMEEALEQAEEERKANEPDSKIFCLSYTIPYYGYRIGDCTPDLGPYIDAAKDPRTWANIAYEMSGLADIESCIKEPAAIKCTVAVLGVTPMGKLRLAFKIDKAVDALKATRTVRRTIACLTGAAHSFPAGTKVLMADGTSRRIEQVQTGDLVTATDPTTGETGPRTVTRTIHTPDDRNFTDLTLTDGSTLTSTSHHPYWSQNDQTWKNASDLKTGDTLRTPQNGTATVARTHDWQGLQDAYDLTVDDLHTYYASTGTTNVLVHNTGGACPLWVKKASDRLNISPGSAGEGLIFNADGAPYLGVDNVLRSGTDATSKEISQFLKESSDFKEWFAGNNLSAAGHPEARTAWMMRNDGAKGDVVHITINKNYICPDGDAHQKGCRYTVPALLYEDQILCVWMPGASTAYPLPGKSKRPNSTWKNPTGDRCAV